MPLARPRLAILVDADSTPVGTAVRALPAAVRLGHVARCAIFGNLAHNVRPCWRAAAEEVKGLPAPRLVHRAGRDAAAFAASFDEIAEGPAALDAICILSSDGAFAAVARRFRAAGLDVHVFGRPETPRPLRVAATSFRAIPPAVAPASGTGAVPAAQ